jgi:hypothetical protein
MNNNQKAEVILSAIMAGASTPNGFLVADHPKTVSRDATENRCAALVKSGALFKVRPPAGYTTYFTSMKALRAFRAKFPETTALATAEKRRANPQLRQEPSVTRQPTPHREAAIVYPERYIKSVRLMPAPRNQVITHSFIHGGMGAMQ